MSDIRLESPLYSLLEHKAMILLQKILKFEPWHSMSTIYQREYAKWIVYHVNESLKQSENSCCVEIGCGLGEIIGNLNARYRYGYDLDSHVLMGAKLLNLGRGGAYSLGTFQNVNISRDIDFLIAVNFLHNISPAEFKKSFDSLLERNFVKNIIVDTVNGEGYKYAHDFKEVIGEKYCLKEQSRRYNMFGWAKRIIEVYGRRDIH